MVKVPKSEGTEQDLNPGCVCLRSLGFFRDEQVTNMLNEAASSVFVTVKGNHFERPAQ